MGIEEGDKKPNAKLAAVALAVEDFCDSFTNRKLEADTYTQDFTYSYLDGTGDKIMYLPLYPVSYVSEVNIDSDRTFGSGTVLASADFFWYPGGKLVSEGSYFTKGRRNIRVGYTAGYAPIVGGTHDGAVSSYPVPLDMKQVLLEMAVESVKEGMTAIHSLKGENPRLEKLFSMNSFWRETLLKYKSWDASLQGFEE
jgi:hypothetical protein